MANQAQLAQLRLGAEAWNHWRWQIKVNTGRAAQVNLRGADLREANLYRAKLNGVDLSEAMLDKADLRKADLSGTRLMGANLRKAQLQGASLIWTNLCGADLREANLCGAHIANADVRGANLRDADLGGAFLYGGVLFLPPEMSCARLHNANWIQPDFHVRRHSTPPSAYREPLLRALIELGGTAHKILVFDRVGALMKPILQECDYASSQKVHRGEHIHWRQFAAWQRRIMVKEGLLQATSPKGVLEITEAGRLAFLGLQ